MSDKLTAEELARLTEKGHRADMLKGTIDETLEQMRGSIFATFESMSVDDKDGFQLLRLYLQLLDDFKGKLYASIASGEKAMLDMERLKQKLN